MSAGFKTVSHTEAMDLLSQDNGVVVVDVRDTDAYQEAHIPGAQHLAMDQLSDFCQELKPEQPVLVYCYHGISSRSVAQHLVDLDVANVFSLDGGFETWQANHPVETSSAK